MPDIIVDARPTELVLRNQIERIGINVRDASGNALDITRPGGTLTLTVTAMNDTVIFTDDWVNDVAGTNIQHGGAGTGRYYFPYGSGVPATNLASTLGDYLFRWKVAPVAGEEVQDIIQVARVISAMTMALLPDFRLLIDKAVKTIDEDPDDPFYLGYTDAQLISYLYGGLSIINAYQPYPLWDSVEAFPLAYFKQVLLDSALVVGAQSQELFAVDTDIDQWSDQGNVFTIQHQPKLAAFIQRMEQKLDRVIPHMKRHAVASGSIRVEFGPNYRLAQLVAAAPTGALFRNIWTAG